MRIVKYMVPICAMDCADWYTSLVADTLHRVLHEPDFYLSISTYLSEDMEDCIYMELVEIVEAVLDRLGQYRYRLELLTARLLGDEIELILVERQGVV